LYKSPRAGLLVELVVSLAVGLALGFKYTPQAAFGIIGTALVVIVVVGALLLIPGFFSVAGITGVPGLSFISALTSPYKYAPFVMAAWLVVGIVVLFWLRSSRPETVEKVAHIHLEDEGM
jgi:hypothetical protein